MKRKLGALLVFLVLFGLQAFASSIYDPCTLSSPCTFSMTGITTITGTTMTWNSNQPGNAPNLFTFNLGTNVFSIIPGGSQESVQNVNFAVESPGSHFGPFPFIAFPTTPVLPGLNLDFIDPGWATSAACTATPAPGQFCTPTGPLSGFTFANGAGGTSSLFITFEGVTADNAATWSANLSTQFDVPYQNVLSALSSGGGAVQSSYSSADFVFKSTAVPEPGTLSLLAVGCIAVTGWARRRVIK